MSATTDRLEVEVAAIRALDNDAGLYRRTAARHDRHFARIMQLIAPRIRHFVSHYGLADFREDAEQTCAIGVHRAIGEYDPGRARFTTFVNWLLRAELQALRFRLRQDARDSARKVGARTLSLDAMLDDAGEGCGLQVEDRTAIETAESRAAARLAEETLDELLGAYEDSSRREATELDARLRMRDRETRPGTLHPEGVVAMEETLARERAIVTRYVFAEDSEPRFDPDNPLSAEQQRQVTRRVLRKLRAHAESRMLH